MNNTSRALAALSLGTAALLGALAAPASAAPMPGIGGLGGLDLCKTLHGLPIAGAVGDVTCAGAGGIPVIGSLLNPILSAPR